MNPFSGSNGLPLLPHRANGAQHDRPLTPGKERKKDRMATVLLFASKQHTYCVNSIKYGLERQIGAFMGALLLPRIRVGCDFFQE